MALQSRNPSTGELLHSRDEMSSDDVQTKLNGTRQAQLVWRRESFARRAELMNDAARVLEDNALQYARLMAQEMGKPVGQGRSEIQKCAWVCRYYADHAQEFLAAEPIETEAASSFVTFQPLGVILAIMPWNFPFWQVFRFAAPALMAGNGAVLKHAANVPQCAHAIEDVFQRAGFPSHLFANLPVGREQVTRLIQDPVIAAVTLTGSTAAGRAVASAAGQALKKTVLELGGSDPYLILADADLDDAVEACTTARMINSGQSCIAGKRFLVVEQHRQAFEQRIVEAMRQQKVGDPLDEATDVGPLARRDLRDTLHGQVQQSIEGGARCLLGGAIPDGDGAFYPPTVLTDVHSGMPAYDEELFGPVAVIIAVKDKFEAVEKANDSPFGLGAAVFTQNATDGERIATEEIEAGCCFVNTFVRSDPRLPFGGVKESGFGRELSHYGIREFVNIKTVYVK